MKRCRLESAHERETKQNLAKSYFNKRKTLQGALQEKKGSKNIWRLIAITTRFEVMTSQYHSRAGIKSMTLEIVQRASPISFVDIFKKMLHYLKELFQCSLSSTTVQLNCTYVRAQYSHEVTKTSLCLCTATMTNKLFNNCSNIYNCFSFQINHMGSKA